MRFPGENHDLSRNGKPSHRVERFEQILAWVHEKPSAASPVAATTAAE